MDEYRRNLSVNLSVPPEAAKIYSTLEAHGETRVDPWFWMNDREDPRVLQYLREENEWCDTTLAPTKELQDAIYREIRARIPQDDQTVPVRIRKWWYSTRFEDGKDYPIHLRRSGIDEPDEVILDVNEFTSGRSYVEVATRAISPDGKWLAYAIDPVGRRLYIIHIRDLETGKELVDEIQDTSGDLLWGEDGKTIYYTVKDRQTLRPHKVLRHRVGTSTAEDECIFEEPDDTYYLGLSKSKSRKFILITSEHTLRSEVHYLDAHDPSSQPRVFLSRSGKHEYDVDHHGDWWWIISNDQARDFRLMRAPTDQPGQEHWREMVSHREGHLLLGAELFDRHVVLMERFEGLRRMSVLDLDGHHLRDLEFEGGVMEIAFGPNPEAGEPVVRVMFNSPCFPVTTLDFDLDTGVSHQLKQEQVGLDYDPENYHCERVWAMSRDGERIPVSVVRHKATPTDGSAPMVVYGYGSYGIAIDPSFSAARVSLLDRGFVFCIAHIRGGCEMGRRWYEEGRTKKKWNTFHDFIDATKHLHEHGYGSSGCTFAWGGSAGGMLVGAVLNDAPDLFTGAIAQVPFVDVVTTMLDDTIPLTTGEYDEWGDPRREEDFRLMLSYSPYDNVEPDTISNLLVLSGLHDSQVQYWEPTKWVAKIRDTHSGRAPSVLLHTNMAAGHGGASGRYARYRETALQYAFLLERSECAWRNLPAALATGTDKN
jgi:oligopeptidase B